MFGCSDVYHWMGRTACPTRHRGSGVGVAIQDSPWHEYRGRGPITKNQVAALLRDYDIRSVVLHPTKRADFSRHGYKAAQFEDAFARFLAHEPNIRTLKRGRDGM